MLKVRVIASWNQREFETKLQQFVSNLATDDNNLNDIQYSTCVDPEDNSTHYSALVTYVINSK